MTPRDVHDYEAQGVELARKWVAEPLTKYAAQAFAAALRAEGRAALLAAANRFDRLADTQRPVSIMGIYEAVNLLRDYANELIAPAPESPPTTDPIHEAYLAADEYGQPPVAPAPDLRDLLKQAADMLRSRASTDEDRAYVACFDTALASPDPRDQRIAEPEPPHWRIGRHYGIHVYRGDTPIATFHTVEDAKAAVRAYNASLDLSAPAPDLAAQLDELSNALASHADAETGAKWDRLRAAVGARDQRIAELEAAVRWALGEEPLKDGRWFDYRAFGHKDNAAPPYWWRSILRLYSGLPDDPAPSKEPPP